MHELGIIFEVINTVEDIVKEEHLSEVASITLGVGEVSLVIPQYLRECWPAAVYKHPLFENTELKIHVIPGEAKCKDCGTYFNIIQTEGYCPKCNSFDKEIISGSEFLIEEIEAC